MRLTTLYCDICQHSIAKIRSMPSNPPPEFKHNRFTYEHIVLDICDECKKFTDTIINDARITIQKSLIDLTREKQGLGNIK